MPIPIDPSLEGLGKAAYDPDDDPAFPASVDVG